MRKSRERKAAQESIPKCSSEDEFLNDDEKQKIICEFEESCEQIKLHHCQSCRRLGIDLKMSKDDSDICQECSKLVPNYFENNNILPIWKDNGVVQYHVPQELKELTDA